MREGEDRWRGLLSRANRNPAKRKVTLELPHLYWGCQLMGCRYMEMWKSRSKFRGPCPILPFCVCFRESHGYQEAGPGRGTKMI